MTLEEKYKKLLELVGKYDKFAEEMKDEYISEIDRGFFMPSTVTILINETNDEFNALRKELKEIEDE